MCERENLIENLAAGIRKRGLTGPAVLTLEMLSPFSFLISQVGLMLGPFVSVFSRDSGRRYSQYAELFQERENVDHLLAALEE